MRERMKHDQLSRHPNSSRSSVPLMLAVVWLHPARKRPLQNLLESLNLTLRSFLNACRADTVQFICCCNAQPLIAFPRLMCMRNFYRRHVHS